jgi:hypothetical protein
MDLIIRILLSQNTLINVKINFILFLIYEKKKHTLNHIDTTFELDRY